MFVVCPVKFFYVDESRNVIGAVHNYRVKYVDFGLRLSPSRDESRGGLDSTSILTHTPDPHRRL